MFGPRLAAIFDFEPFRDIRDKKTNFKYFNHICHPQQHIFGDQFCVSVIIINWDTENHIFLFFGLSFEAVILKMPQERVCPKISLLTLQILIL